MDLGEPFKQTLVIQPGGDGSFIVMARTIENKLSVEVKFGFTTIDDLLIWMARHGTKAHVAKLKLGDVVKPEVAQAYQEFRDRASQAGALCGMDALNGLKRTTAAKTLAERVEAMGSHPVNDYDDPRLNPSDAA